MDVQCEGRKREMCSMKIEKQREATTWDDDRHEGADERAETSGTLKQHTRTYISAHPLDPCTSVDVRDVARVHVRAIRAPPATGTNWRRYVVASPNPFSWKDAIQLVLERRPELRARLVDPAGAPDWPERENRIILSKEEADEQNALFGVKQAGTDGESGKVEDLWEYRAFEETVLDGIDSIVEIERVWDQGA